MGLGRGRGFLFLKNPTIHIVSKTYRSCPLNMQSTGSHGKLQGILNNKCNNLTRKGRNVLLMLDSSPAHSHMELLFFSQWACVQLKTQRVISGGFWISN
jgi:hypothetical protein